MNRRDFLARSSLVSTAALLVPPNLFGQAASPETQSSSAVPPLEAKPTIASLPASPKILGPRASPPDDCFKFCPPPVRAEGVLCSDMAYLKQRVTSAFSHRFKDPTILYFSDTQYYLPCVQEVKTILAKSVFAQLSYKDNRFDCDDFAFGVKAECSLYSYPADRVLTGYAFAFGVVMGEFKWQRSSEDHAACFFVDKNYSVHLIEPREPWREIWKQRYSKSVAASSAGSSAEFELSEIDPDRIVLHTPDECNRCFFVLL